VEYTIKGPDTEKDRIEQMICDRHGWDGVNPPTKAEFVVSYLANHLREEVFAQEWVVITSQEMTNHQAAMAAAKAAVDADTSLDTIGK
jgi:hypothetical protein